MSKFWKYVNKFLQEEEGLTTVEYAIAGSLVGLAVVGAFTDLGDSVGDVIVGLDEAVCGSGSGSPCD